VANAENLGAFSVSPAPPPKPSLARRLAFSLLRVAVVLVALISALLLAFQDRLIYFPQAYGVGFERELPAGMFALRYATDQGAQTAFYQPSRKALKRLWMVFGGNAATALGWTDFIAGFPDEHAGFLLVDYPGYGACAGKPSPDSILASTEAAVAAAAAHVGTPVADLEKRLCVLGHSLGAAAALQFAVKHPVQQVVLVSPFTSLRAMGRRVVGWPLCYLVLHNLDNEARLAELVARTPPPPIAIVHGDQDEVIPVTMGRALAKKFAGSVVYHEMPGDDHNGIIDVEKPLLHRVMSGR
jgi:pimeloyl-ACP methyl ester carboxylesterase